MDQGQMQEEDAKRTGMQCSVIEGGEVEQHEKKSVMKRVKDGAKKIKDTISKKKHGHDGESPRDEEEEEGYVEDDKDGKEEDPEVHGATMYESEGARDFVSSHEEGPEAKERLGSSGGGGRWEEDPGAPKAGSETPVPGSYQATVTDYSFQGGPEPGVIRSFQALSVSDQPGKEKGGETGRHDQFSPDSPPSGVNGGAAQTVSKEAEAGRQETHEQQRRGEQSYVERISSATSTIADRVAHAKDAAVSAAVGSAEYGKRIAGSAVARSESQPPLQQRRQEQEGREGSAGSETAGGGKAKGVSIREYLAEKLSPGEEDRALCEAISEAIQRKKDEEGDVRGEADERPPAAEEKMAGKGVMGKIRGAVTSLFGGSQAAASAEAGGEAMDSSQVEQEGSPKRQESQGR